MAAHASLNQPSPLRDMHEAVSAWFLGPRAENFELVKELFNGVLDRQAEVRLNYHQEDQDFITTSIKSSKVYEANVKALRESVDALSKVMNEYSVPFFSPRYIGHMCMEMSLPAIMGWISTIMFNPNNVAFEASPITTILELEVGRQLCEMLGYSESLTETEGTKPWGHVACDGTVANMESMWVARNLKFYPLAVRTAIDEGMLSFIGDTFEITPAGPDGTQPKLFKMLSDWELLNLPTKEILGITDRLHAEYGISAKFLEDALKPYLVQSAGKEKMMQKYNISPDKTPQYLISSTKHYSWPKSAALLGIGSDNCVQIPVDHQARINIAELRKLLDSKLESKQPVYAVVAIIGSTEEGTVDPLDEVIELRDEYQQKGLSFIVHADAAWGGYFASMIRDPPPGAPSRWDDELDVEGSRDFVPSITMRESSVKQFHALANADSITIDPHKAGYVPYPAGGLCYRDGRMRYLVTWTAPYLHDSEDGESIGVYGIEGSKPGAPAVACFLHNSIVGLHKEGHGGLLGEVAFTCRRFSAHWAAMSDSETPYIVMPFNPLVNDGNKDKEDQEKQFIRTRILHKSNQEIVQDQEAMDELCALGSDLNINAFACNFRINGRVNEDVEDANYLNNRVFDRLSVTKVWEKPQDIPLFLSSTIFGREDYGECLRNYKQRMGLETDSEQDLFVLRNVVMSPFQGVSDYPGRMAELFENVLKEETKNVIERATISPQDHSFTMQGHDKIFLTYRPLFHRANGRAQLILTADIANPLAMHQYKHAREHHPDAIYTCTTAHVTTLDDIIHHGHFHANISGKGLDMHEVQLTNVRVVKRRGLESRYRDPQYPEKSTPFYLYGTQSEHHIEHMLLCAPNAQITADSVKLDVHPPLTKEQLEHGVIMHIDRPERALQPPAPDNKPESMFKPGAKFNVTIVEDIKPAQAHGPGLAEGGKRLAVGKVTLGRSVYVDWETINTQDFAPGPTRVTTLVEREADRGTKREWQHMVRQAMHF